MQPNIKQRENDVIDHLLHQIDGQLCVIKMEATMPLQGQNTRFTLDAVKNIEGLLRKIRQTFLPQLQIRREETKQALPR